MNNIKNIEGKTVKSVESNNDGNNSYLIMKFEDGGKVNIISYPNGGNGVGQLDLRLGQNEIESIVGKRIWKVEEEFNGEDDMLKILFRDKSKLEILSFCSAEDSTASLEYTVYDNQKIVAESINIDNNTAEDWQRIHSLVFERTESGDIQDERELKLVINTLKGLKKRGIYPYIEEEDIEDAAWEGFTDAKYNDLNESAQYEAAFKENSAKAKLLELWAEAAIIFADLEEWLKKHNIHDQDEELEEIESWLDINLEGEDERVRDRVFDLVRNKYDIE